VENNYNPNIPKWANVNYLRTSMYDAAHLDVLEEALPFQTNHKSKGIQNVEIMILWIQPSWLKFFLKFVHFIELENM